MPQVALSADFLKAFARIPRSQQKKVRQFLDKFRADPTAASINYEPISDMRDPKVRTVRIDQAYRGIVIHPPKGDVYLMVWVDHHDEAMAWARNKMFEVNRVTGSFQVWEPIEEEAVLEEVAPTVEPVALVESDVVPPGFLFSGQPNDTLMLVGVPEPLLAAVRTLRTEADLDRLAQYLPAEATDALYLLAAGYDIEQTLDELDRLTVTGDKDVPQAVDTEDFVAALERPESKREFKIVEDDHELSDVLNAQLHVWRVFLHPSQEKLVRIDAKGPTRVLGGAGTGKTVVAMHRARHLVTKVYPGATDRVLFTTFTKNLARDISEQLDHLCGPERERIEVTNLDAWASSFLKQQGLKFKPLQEAQAKRIWAEVYAEEGDDSLPLSFYLEEWRQVVQAQDVLDPEGYLRARRVGRGTRLSRAQRKAVWNVFAAYRRRLEAEHKLEIDDVIRQARMMIDKEPGSVSYRAVVADEVQDFSPSDFRLLRRLVPEGQNDLFLVGDAHQRIYGYKTSLSRCGINVRGRRSRRLKINYRTTDRIRNWAVAILKGLEIDDLDEGVDTLKGYRSLRRGVEPEVVHWDTPEEEASYIIDRLRTWLEHRPPEHICIAVHSHALIEQRYLPLLAQAKIPAAELAADHESTLPSAVRIATMHRVKGLEFPCMLLASIQSGELARTDNKDFADQASRAAYIEQERRLLYVAATRARDELVITGFGDRCNFVPK
jgi:hypothetical protein